MKRSSFIHFWFSLSVLLASVGTSCDSKKTPATPAKNSPKQNSITEANTQNDQVPDLEAYLVELGAKPGLSPAKGLGPLNGWGSPYLARSKEGALKKQLSYDRYISFLRLHVDETETDSLLYTVLYFTLDEMGHRQIKFKPEHKKLILSLCKSYLDDRTKTVYRVDGAGLTLIRDQMTTKEWIELYRSVDRFSLFYHLPVPVSKDQEYVDLLTQIIEDKQVVEWGQTVTYSLLFSMDSQKHREGFLQFLLERCASSDAWGTRSIMYEWLIVLGGEKAFDSVRKGLLNDPIAEVRERTLYSLKKNGKVEEVIDVIHELASGGGARYRGVSLSRPGLGISSVLINYLDWAQTQNDLPTTTQAKVKSAAKLASELPFRPVFKEDFSKP